MQMRHLTRSFTFPKLDINRDEIGEFSHITVRIFPKDPGSIKRTIRFDFDCSSILAEQVSSFRLCLDRACSWADMIVGTDAADCIETELKNE